MAFTYILMNLVFMTAVLLALRKWLRRPNAAAWVTLGSLLILTLIFDNVILWAGFVEYDTSKLLGLYLGLAPIEDFFYAILAAVIIPVLWVALDKKRRGSEA